MSDEQNESVDVNTGIIADPGFNASRSVIEQAQMRDYDRRRPAPGVVVPLPNSEFARVQTAMPGAWYPGERTDGMLGNPRLILRNPKPDWDPRMPRYVWFLREDTVRHGSTPRHSATNALERSGRIRYIEEKEVDQKSPHALYETYELAGGIGADGKPLPKRRLVTTGSMILAEVLDPKVSYHRYKAWDDYALQQQANLPRELGSTPQLGDIGPGHIPGRTETEVREFAANPKSRAAEGL